MESFPVIDADGHVEESSKGLQKYLRPQNRGRPLWTSDSWDRNFGGALGKVNEDPRVQLEDMDADGIDIQVVYPTRGISLSAAREVDWPAISRAPTTTGWRTFAPSIPRASRALRWWRCRMWARPSPRRGALSKS